MFRNVLHPWIYMSTWARALLGRGFRRIRWWKCILCWISYCFKVKTWSRSWNNYYAFVREIYLGIFGTRNGKSQTGFINIGFSKVLSKDWIRTMLSNDKNKTLANVGNVHQEWFHPPQNVRDFRPRCPLSNPGSTNRKTVSTCDPRADVRDKIQGPRPILAS